MTVDLHSMSIGIIRQMIESGESTAVEICQQYLQRIESKNPALRAFLRTEEEMALQQAGRVDQFKAEGRPLPPLAGVPMAIKDNILVEGMLCTAGSRILENFRAAYDATVIEKLRGAGAVFLGKVNLDEFAMGSSTENSGFFCTRNPHQLDCVPGGSSGGSAAAVASQMALAALGSDTGGSIRQPASLCGVVGLKPTYSRVSRYGLVAYGSSLDQIGPITQNVRDAARILQVIAGHDLHDATSSTRAVEDYVNSMEEPIKGLRIGLPKEYFSAGIDPEVQTSIQAGLRLLESLGAEMIEVELPHTDYAIACYYIIATAEASANLSRYDGVRFGLRVPAENLASMYCDTRDTGFGAEVKRRIILGTFVLSSGYYDAYYLKAQKVRTLIKQDFDRAFEKADVLVSPTSPTPAFRIGEKSNDPLAMYLSDIFTITANLAGIPGISIPCGKNSEGLPIGLQILGNHFEEKRLLNLARAFESQGGFNL
jgi:aspartyl-tRNA(Asn)/glutamyl-tRNA(Gln) amidotransferase subunit A